jgi:putative chitinase
MIHDTVGDHQENENADVRIVQLSLALAGAEPPPVADGFWGAQSLAALRSAGFASGTVAPGDGTLDTLRARFAPGLRPEKIHGTMIAARVAKMTLFAKPIIDTCAKYGIDTPLRQAHFLAQTGHECGDLNYTAELASGQAYEWRRDLGNINAGDGPNFKGRGLIQLTGRANYAAYSRSAGVDYTQPANWGKIASDPAIAADVAGWFWQRNNLNALADADDIEAITRAINGGRNGFDDRLAHYLRARFFFGL